MQSTENLIKKYVIWGYFFCYPLVNAFIPNINLGVVQLNPFRIFLIIPIVYLFFLFLENKGRLIISKENIYLFFYVLFAIFNSWRQDQFIIANVINMTFPFLFLLCFDNLKLSKKDLNQFLNMISILAVFVFSASIIQNYINRSFYSGIRGARWLERYLYGGEHYRHASIFRSIDFYQAGIAIGVLCLIFLFLNNKKFNFKYITLFILMVASTYYTYTRSNWLIPLIGICWFIWFKPFKQKVLILSVGILILFVLYISFYSTLENSDFFKERVTVNTYEGRFESINIYMEHFFGKNMILGFGVDSSISGVFQQYRRPEVHNGYLEVIFQNGILGFILYFAFWFHILKKGILVYKKSGNGVFIAFISILAIVNMVYKFINMNHYGFHLIIFYLYLNYKIYLKVEENDGI